MKKMFALTIAVALMLSAFIVAQSRSAAEEFKAADHKEKVEGDVKGAIDAYNKIAKGKDREYAAKALVAMGDALRRSKDADATKKYQQVIKDFPEQKESVALAETRLKEFAAGSAPPVGLFKTQTRLDFPTTSVLWDTFQSDVAAVTPDGRYLLTFSGMEIDVVTKAERPFGQRLNARSLAVSSDGLQIAYSRNFGGGGGRVSDSSEVSVIDRNDFNPTVGKVLFRSESYIDIRAFGWSPDKKGVFAVLTGRDHSHQIAAISDKGVLRTIKVLDWREPGKLSLSPDGHYIAYDAPVGKQSADRDIFLVSAEGGAESAIARDPARDALPVWTPDGGGIVFTSDRSGSLGLWIVNMTNGKPRGEPRQLTANEGAIEIIGFSRDGSLYFRAVTSLARKSEIYTESVNGDQGDGAPVHPSPVSLATSSPERNDSPRYSPDGKLLAYLSRRAPPFWDPLQSSSLADSITVVVRSLESGAERQFSTGLTEVTGLRWSADGQALRFEGNSGRSGTNPTSSRRIDLQTGTGTDTDLPDLAAGAIGPSNHFPCVSPEGKRIYFMRSTTILGAYEMETKHETVLFTGTSSGSGRGASGPVFARGDCGTALSPDGRYIFLRENRAAETEGYLEGYLIPTTGGAPTKVSLPSKAGHPCFVQWSSDGKAVLAVVARVGCGTPDKGSPLWRIPLDGGAPIALGTVSSADSVSPDGKQVAYTVAKATSVSLSTWVVPDLLLPSNGSHGVFVADLDQGGGKVRGSIVRLAETRSLTGFERSPAWSPDGQSIAYNRGVLPAAGSSSYGDLVVRSLKTGVETSYPANLFVGLRLSWLHDGSLLILGPDPWFDSSGTASGNIILRAELKSSRFQEVLAILGPTGAPRPQPNRLSNPRSPFFAVSPDDKTLYFADNAHAVQGNVSVIAFDLASGRQSPAFALPPGLGLVAGMELSPDGRTFAMWTDADPATGEARLFRIQIDGGGYREIYRGRSNLRSENRFEIRWTRDGKAILFGEEQDNDNWRILRIPADGGAAVSIGLQIRWEGGLGPLKFDLSPDGSRIAFEGTAAAIVSAR